jgi:hypothetical protein
MIRSASIRLAAMRSTSASLAASRLTPFCDDSAPLSVDRNAAGLTVMKDTL